MHDFILGLMMMGAIGSSDAQMPFWSQSGQFGIMPEHSGGLAVIRAATSFDESRPFQWKWDISLAANADASAGTCSLLVDQLYASARWHCLRLDLGCRHRDLDFLAPDPALGSLSVTGGHIVESGNARSVPGYLMTLEPVAVPFTAGRLKIFGSWGDYRPVDDRYVDGALFHRLIAGAGLDFEQLYFKLLLDHYAVWGGDIPGSGKMDVNMENYLRMATGSPAGQDGSLSDRINVIGDQGGSEIFRMGWKGDGWSVDVQHDIPYADRSGMTFRNFPDGVNTLHFGWDDKERWLSDIVYEYHYTMYQSGSMNQESYDEYGNKTTPPGAVLYGGDNYFNNHAYRSGWTYYGRPICSPLMFPVGTRDGLWSSSSHGWGIESNRHKAHHIGLGGMLFRRHPYRLMLTYSMNYGVYGSPYEGESQWNKPWGSVDEIGLKQFSAGFNGLIRGVGKVSGLSLSYGLYADCGELLKDSCGMTLGLSYLF